MNDALRIARILVPVDGSEFSRYAAQHAVRIAQAYASEVIFLHVVDDQIVAELAQWESDDGAQRARERLVEQGQVYLRDVARLADEQGLAHREAIGEGDPCTVICETAGRVDASLVVMGKIGRRGTRRILMGSIARRVIESTDRPVLMISSPPTEESHAAAPQAHT
jgi:nucleotide-binding universal stress UspA family protein